MEKYGFVYIWYDRKHKRYYIGSHWGTEDDNYICSSTWMRNSFNRRPQDFKRRIISRVYTNRKDLFAEEEKWLSLIKEEELKVRYYNFVNVVYHDSWFLDENKKKTIVEKMRQSLLERNAEMTAEERSAKFGYWKGKKSNFKGRTHSSESKQKIKEARAKQDMTSNAVAKRGKPSGAKSKKWSEASKKKLSESKRGISTGPCSEETKEKIGKANSINAKNAWQDPIFRAKMNKQVTCPHCGKSGSHRVMPRWHFSNCKAV